MLTFVWNLYIFQVVDVCHAKGEMFTAGYHIRNILTDLVARLGERGGRRLAVHADNARPYTAKVTKSLAMMILANYATSTVLSCPDLTPSDFPIFGPFLVSLFGHLNNSLQGQQFGLADELLSRVREILDEINFGTLEAVSGSVSTDLTDALHCIALHCIALQQMENTWDEVNNDSLSYF
jgi:hypothetical protein